MSPGKTSKVRCIAWKPTDKASLYLRSVKVWLIDYEMERSQSKNGYRKMVQSQTLAAEETRCTKSEAALDRLTPWAEWLCALQRKVTGRAGWNRTVKRKQSRSTRQLPDLGILGILDKEKRSKAKKVKVAQSCPTPWTIQSMEFSRPEYWSG